MRRDREIMGRSEWYETGLGLETTMKTDLEQKEGEKRIYYGTVGSLESSSQ